MAHGRKAVFFLLVAVLSSFSYNYAQNIPYIERYFDQLVDHFSFSSPSQFKQRYLVQDEWWDPKNGPIFFYTGNEGNIEDFWNNLGFMFDIAPKFKALVLFAEHRYYGKSLPFGKDSFTRENIRYLTTEQALADYAVFISWYKQRLNATQVPVIAFGGSYGGMLSAYMRFKYPNIIAGSIAASAPIYLISGQTSRTFFFDDVTNDFRNVDPQCESRIRRAFIQMETLAGHGKAGLDEIAASFNLCSPLTDERSYRHLLGWIRNSFASITMFDYPYPTVFMAKMPGNPVKLACSYLAQAEDVLQGLAKAAAIFYGNPKCHDITTEYVECADPTGCGLGPNSKAWDYQACTEMVMPGGTNNVTDMFPVLPHTLSQLQAYCNQTWGVQPRQQWMKVNFWGKDLRSASNIVFSNGNLDPWHRGGVSRSVSDSVIAVMIDGGAHHLDLRHSNPADPPSVIKAREIEQQNIAKWIKQYTQSQKPQDDTLYFKHAL